MITHKLTPLILETIARTNSMACWWPGYTNPIAEPRWSDIAIDLEEVASRPGDAEFKAQLRAAADYARMRATSIDRAEPGTAARSSIS